MFSFIFTLIIRILAAFDAVVNVAFETFKFLFKSTIDISMVTLLLFGVFVIFVPSVYNASTSELPAKGDRFKGKAKTSVQILVLGDIGRSPRMQNHAISLARQGARVDLLGFVESDIHESLKTSDMVRVFPLSPVPDFFRTDSKLKFTLLAPLKVAWQIANLVFLLCFKSRACKWMLVQNPPSIPTLAIAKLVCLGRNTRLVIDWHNTGWSILALRLGPRHFLVTLAEFYEKQLAKTADFHFAVSKSMCDFLKGELNVNATPLYDRPTVDFKPLFADQRLQTLSRIKETSAYADDIQAGTCRLIMSSTSWTKDEDFSMLLDALVGYSAQVALDKSMPSILAVITGKGAGKEYYLERICQLNKDGKLSHASIVTGWFTLEDYTSLLGSADLGVCLHMSSSGLDLPMKVVDMFGVGLPVIGYSGYSSWRELVREGVNGRGFSTVEELESLLVNLFSENGTLLDILKEGALKEREHTWDQEWNRTAGEVFFFSETSTSNDKS